MLFLFHFLNTISRALRVKLTFERSRRMVQRFDPPPKKKMKGLMKGRLSLAYRFSITEKKSTWECRFDVNNCSCGE